MYYRSISILIFLGLSVVACHSGKKERQIPGHYISKEATLAENWTQLFDNFTRGLKVDLQADSTFRFEMCTSIATGIWKVYQDSLILTCLDHRGKKDTSELFGKWRISYLINEAGIFHREYTLKKKKKVHDYLVKVERFDDSSSSKCLK